MFNATSHPAHKTLTQLVDASEAIAASLANPLRTDPVGTTGQPITGVMARLGTAVTPITTGSTTAASGAITGTAVRLVATKDCHVVFGAAPEATVNDTFLPANVPEYFWITSGHKLAAIQDAEAGKVYITPVTFV